MSLFIASSFGNPIAPDTAVKFAMEGETVLLSCRYNGTNYGLHWYRQFPLSVPQFLILDYQGIITKCDSSCSWDINKTFLWAGTHSLTT